MATKNPITGDELISKAPTEEYKAGWDRIFGRPTKTYTGGVPSPVRCKECDCYGGECRKVWLEEEQNKALEKLNRAAESNGEWL